METLTGFWPTAEDRTRTASESIVSASLGGRRAPQRVGHVRVSESPSILTKARVAWR